jgi:hypothetical protein
MTIAGTYMTRHESQLTITTDGNIVSGTMYTEFGRAHIIGSVGSSENYTAISFTAYWEGSDGYPETVTTYSGQYQKINDDIEQINVIFLLATTGQFKENYKMNNIGYDLFRKVK